MDLTNNFAAARKASGLTYDQAATACNLSRASYFVRENEHPEQFRLCELAGLHCQLTDTAKPILMKAIEDIFLPE